MKKKFAALVYRLIKWFVRLFYPKIESVGTENIPDEPVLFVGNHSQMHGPIACELYFPVERYTWCAGEMMHLREVPDYAFRDFWSHKPKFIRWFYRLLSYIIAPFSVCVFNNAKTIAVYHDSRVISTFKQTVKVLAAGTSVVVFPEKDAPHNHILCQFQDRFVDVARLYYKKTGKALAFVPFYLAPNLKTMYFGLPIPFRPESPVEEERQRICRELMEAVTQMAVSLPRHRVVPYWNLPKKDYPLNVSKGANVEKT